MYMDNDTALLLEDLRKKSRTLLALTANNSEKINREIKKLYLQNSTLGQCYEKNERQNPYLRNHREIWKRRNDSSAVSDLLCQDYYNENKNRTTVSAPNMRPLERIVIPSRNLSHTQCTRVANRKPVKECYCNVEIRKIQSRSPRTRHKPTSLYNYCKSHACHLPLSPKEDNLHDVSPPISCETIRRVQKINYSPKSQFLRNVQKKVSVLKNVPYGDCPDVCPRSSYYHELRLDKAAEIDTQSKSRSHASNKPSTADFEKQWEEFVGEEEEEWEPRREVTKLKESVQVPSRKTSKTKLLAKETIPSKKSTSERRKEESEKLKNSERRESETYRIYPEDYGEDFYEQGNWVLRREKDDQEKTDRSSSKEVKELNKFREQNYFDTHGSSQTLASSKSSGSLQQCLLNDRLFAEPVKRIHRNDLVVTMPPCATIQKKRVHYFPRYVVRQEKSNCNTNYKKKRCHQSCPLTGHAIDLGITKPRPVLNSLALKYQKRFP